MTVRKRGTEIHRRAWTRAYDSCLRFQCGCCFSDRFLFFHAFCDILQFRGRRDVDEAQSLAKTAIQVSVKNEL